MKLYIKSIILFVLSILMGTCSQSGIFYDLESEVKIQEKNNLDNSAVFSSMFKIGNYYFGNGGVNIFYRSDSSSSSADDWSTLKLPDGSSDSDGIAYGNDIAVTSMVKSDEGELYISVISQDGDSRVSGIYKIDDASSPSSISAGNWDMQVKKVEEKTNSTQYSHVFYLFAVAKSSDNVTDDDDLFINYVTYQYANDADITATIATSKLYTTAMSTDINNDLASNTTEIDISGFVPETSKVEKIVGLGGLTATPNDDKYWMIINGADEGKLFFSDTPSGFTTAESGSPSSVKFVDIYPINDTLEDDRILLSDTASKLYIYDQSDNTFRELSKGDAWFKGFCSIDGLGSISSNQVIVGTIGYIGDSTYDGEGYYQLDVSDADYNNWDWVSSNLSDENNYTSSDLANSSINGFYFDSSNDRLFAYTVNSGVWVNQEEDSKRIWARE